MNQATPEVAIRRQKCSWNLLQSPGGGQKAPLKPARDSGIQAELHQHLANSGKRQLLQVAKDMVEGVLSKSFNVC